MLLSRLVNTQTKRITLIVAAFLVAVSSLLVFDTNKANAATVITTSTNTNAVGYTPQRKTFYDTQNSKYWAFYYDGSVIQYYNSGNSTSWSSAGSYSAATNFFSVWYVSGTTTVYMAYLLSGSGALVVKGTLSSGSISWGSPGTVDSGASTATHTDITISRDTSGILWAGYYKTANLQAASSVSADDPSSWNSPTTIGDDSHDSEPTIVPMTTTGNMYVAYTGCASSTAKVKGQLYNGSWGSISTVTSRGSITCQTSDSTYGILSAVSGTSDTVHLEYSDYTGQPFNGGAIKYYNYASGAWGSAVTLDSSSSDRFPSIVIDPATSIVYAFWYHVIPNAIQYKRGMSPYSSPNWDASLTTLVSIPNSVQAMTAGYSNNRVFVEYSEGRNSPWNVDFATVNLPPGAPTLSTPYIGATSFVASTNPQLQMSSTDVEGDSIKYKVLVYNSTANDGTNCTGTSYETADQNSSGTGWDNGTTAYSSGATATYTVQTTMSPTTGYCWQAQSKDPSGSNLFGSLSAPSTFTINSSPAIPTLSSPTTTNTSVNPRFLLRSTDPDSDYLEYYIEIYDATACGGSLVRTVDQTSSQTGWEGQDQSSGHAYTGAPSIAGSTPATYVYQNLPLTGGHLYSWRAKVKDPAGANAFTSFSGCQDFTTAAGEVQIQGGVDIRGGTTIQ